MDRRLQRLARRAAVVRVVHVRSLRRAAVHLHLHLFMYEVVGLQLPCGRLGIPLRCFDNVHRIRDDVSSLSAGFP